MYYKRSRSSVKGQGHSVKTAYIRQIIAFSCEIGVAECNGHTRILTGSLEIAVCAHAQYKFEQNSPERLARRRAASSCNAFAIDTFSSFFICFLCTSCLLLFSVYTLFRCTLIYLI